MSEVNVELGLPASTNISLDQGSVRTLAGVASGAISMQNLQGKANAFSFALSGSNVDLRTAAISAGWDGTTKVKAAVNFGAVISSTSNGTPALTISGAFPNGVELTNDGTIVGMGGGGGSGGGTGPASKSVGPTYPGSAGSSGGTALSVSVPVTITNNGTVAGGGGGGGGGGSGMQAGGTTTTAGGGGGGGGKSSATNSSGGAGGVAGTATFRSPGTAGSPGTYTGAGTGGPRGAYNWGPGAAYGGNGGAGGDWGSGGAAGGNGSWSGSIGGSKPGGGGGGAGPCTVGNANITWAATGTRLGPLN